MLVVDRIQLYVFFFFFQAEDGIRDLTVTGVQTCALPIFPRPVLHVAADRLLPHGAEGGRGVRPGGRGHAHPGALAHRAADGRAWARLRGALRLHALVERVHLRAHLHLVLGADHGERRGHDRADPRRHLLLGLAHGGGRPPVGPRPGPPPLLSPPLRSPPPPRGAPKRPGRRPGPNPPPPPPAPP